MSWLPFYREAVQVLATFETRQPELLALIEEMRTAGLPVIATTDYEIEDGLAGALDEIDPFTFLANFHRSGDDTRLALWRWLAAKWKLSQPVPTSLAGLPVVMANASWFLAWKHARASDDVEVLWRVFQTACESGPHELPNDLWQRALEVRTVGVAKLTIGLFWTNAEKYLSLDSVMQKYLRRYGITPDLAAIASSIVDYRELLARVHEALGFDHIHISREAWETRNAPEAEPQVLAGRKKRYWCGGHQWGADSQLPRFLKDQEWQNGYTRSDATPAARSSLELFDKIRPGDALAIKGGNPQSLTIYALGTVNRREDITRTLKLTGLHKVEPKRQFSSLPVLSSATWTKTLFEVTDPRDIALIFGHEDASQVLEAEPQDDAPQVLELPQVLAEDEDVPPLPDDAALNLIFYGPPGTGKTYRMTEESVFLIDAAVPTLPANDGASGNIDRAALKSRFDDLRDAGRIEFATFHQSFGYEEFVEGLRPRVDAEGAARFEVRDGVLKRIALRATGAMLEPSQPGRASFEQLWSALEEKIESDPKWEMPGLSTRSRWILEIDGETVRAQNLGGVERAYQAPLAYVRAVWEKLRDGPRASHNAVRSILQKGAQTHLIGAVVEELKRLQAQTTPGANTWGNVPTASDLEERGRAWLNGSREWKLKPPGKWPRFVLVIDEINRGNVSKILGELITLLEDDKRTACENAVSITLPSSLERFALPPNLYVRGTMNTADKSLALLDVALRRRFEFRELAPRFEVCRDLTPAMRQVLAELNHRLTLVRDREHRIGHAFFVRAQDEKGFNRAFERKVIPLLQEFFANDWESLRLVLGEKGARKGGFIRPFGARDDEDGDAGAGFGGGYSHGGTRWQWWLDEAPDEGLSCLETLARNYGIREDSGLVPQAPELELPVAESPHAAEEADALDDLKPEPQADS